MSEIDGNINTNFYAHRVIANYLVTCHKAFKNIYFLRDVPFLKQTNSGRFYFGKMAALVLSHAP